MRFQGIPCVVTEHSRRAVYSVYTISCSMFGTSTEITGWRPERKWLFFDGFYPLCTACLYQSAATLLKSQGGGQTQNGIILFLTRLFFTGSLRAKHGTQLVKYNAGRYFKTRVKMTHVDYLW